MKKSLIAAGLAIALALHGKAFSQQSELEHIAELQTLSERDHAGALQQLKALGLTFGPHTRYEILREYLNTRTALEIDAAQLEAAGESQAKLLALAQAHHDDIGHVLAASNGAFILTLGGKTDLAIAKLAAIEPVVQRIRHPEALWNFHFVLGQAQLTAGSFEAAIASALKSQSYALERPTQSKLSLLHSLSLLARIYTDMTNQDKALSVLEDALRIAKDVHSSKLRATLHLNRGNVYNSLKKLPLAFADYERALDISRKADLTVLQGTAINNIADTHLQSRDYRKAEELARKALERFQTAGDAQGIVIAQANVGFSLMGQGKVSEGAALVRVALGQSKQSGAKADQELILGELAAMYEQQGLYREAIAAMNEQHTLASELFRSDREKSVAALHEQFDAVQRDKQIELLARENALKDAEINGQRLQTTVALLGVAVVVMASGIVFVMYRRVRKANQRLSEVNQQLEIHSAHDPLTGLYNRRHFLEMMDKRPGDASAGRRGGDSPDGLLILDIDHFKTINDTYGHAAGDTVLKEVAARLRATVRDTDVVVRWGGEEFLVFSPKSNADHLVRLANRVLQVVASTPITTDNATLNITVTGGFLSLPFSGLSEAECNWEKAMQFADMALYLGKARGRNRAYGLTRLLVPFAQATPLLEHDIAAALDANIVELVEVIGP
ncbi:MAG: GGDEF domain-containing protein [Rhodoferax sp.]|nr:GGDEF domain-containing protein [Rhodoferax sp.]